MATSEVAFNIKLADALRARLPGWEEVSAESTGAISQSRRKPDILAKSRGEGTVIIETEWKPARSVEEDALAGFSRQTSTTIAFRASCTGSNRAGHMLNRRISTYCLPTISKSSFACSLLRLKDTQRRVG